MAIKQDSRQLAIKTALDTDVLAVRSIIVHEHLNKLFHIEAELASEDSQIPFDKVVGHNATIRMDLGQKGKRFFNGFVSRLVQTANEGGYARYRATIVPWLWLLTRCAESRVWVAAEEPDKGKTVPEIIESVFKAHGFNDYKLDGLSASYPKREFCVQYRETAFNFVSRLMEQEGICYFFKHENGKHTLVLADSISAHTAYPNYADMVFHDLASGSAGKEVVHQWTQEKEMQAVGYILTDFDFKKPRTSLEVLSNVNRDYGNAGFVIHDHPGEYLEHKEGDRLVGVRLDEVQSQLEVAHGQASVRGLAAGFIFKLKNHSRADQNADYFTIGVSIQADAGEFGAAAGGNKAAEFFSCSFTAIRKAQQFRPSRLTPKPIVQGPQTAIVVGLESEEIYTDEHARVKVQFHWDRYGKMDENSSCWVRVSQYWAGKSWGAMHIPRKGQEVIVEFLEGDPDRPIITGRVYNGEQVPPYPLPAEKTKSTVKSNSSLGGGGSNEFRFEDKKGKEEVFLHGEKDWTIHVKNCENETVGSSISTNAGANISRSAGANISRTANVTITDKAGKDIVANSGKNMDLQAGGSYQLWTNLGIHLKAMNFVVSVIESGAKAAAGAIMKGAAGGAAGKTGIGDKASGAAGGAVEAAQTKGVEALGPAVSNLHTELNSLRANADKNMAAAGKHGSAAGEAAAVLTQAISSGASREVIAAGVMALAGACYDTYKDAKKLIEDSLPQIPSIVLWAMKDINATALWSMSLETKVKDISIEAKNKNVNVKGKQNISVEACKQNVNIKAKQNINVEASDQDVNIKATKKQVCITAKEAVNITAEDKDIVVEAKAKKVFVKSAKQIFLKCGSASISMAESGNIVIKGAKINIEGSSPVSVKGNPVKLN